MWLIPSLNRPHLMERFFKAYVKTLASTPGLLLVDKKDPQLDAYRNLKLPENWKLIETDAVTMGDKFRETWDIYKDCDWIGVLNDDHVPITEKWDLAVLSHINGKNMVSTNDNWQFPSRICGAIAFSGPLIRALGWLFPPGMHHLFSDDVWQHIAVKTDCLSMLRDVTVEHDHAYKNKELEDDTFFKINGKDGLKDGRGTGGFWENDEKIYKDWLDKDFRNDIAKITKILPVSGVMIATPFKSHELYIGFALGLVKSLQSLPRHGVAVTFEHLIGSGLIAFARNILVDRFLRSTCKKLLFIDADEGFKADDVMRLYNSNKPIIGGMVPRKAFPINIVFDPLDEHKKHFKNTKTKSLKEVMDLAKEKGNSLGELEVKRAGTGFLMIDRSVFEYLTPHVTEYEAYEGKGERHLEFFTTGKSKESEKYNGEDWDFCELARRHGFKIHIDTGVKITHLGEFVFDCNMESK